MKTTRELAEDLLNHANHELKDTPDSPAAQVALAHATRAQLFATCALTNAVLDVAEAIRETHGHDH